MKYCVGVENKLYFILESRNRKAKGEEHVYSK